MYKNTVVQLTPPGRGAIATLLVEGPTALAVVQASFRSPVGNALRGVPASGKPLDSFIPDRLAFGHFGPQPGEEVVVRVRSDQSVELHCHGGQAAVAMVQQALIDQGCQSIAWQDWIHPESAEPLDPEPRTPDPKPQSAWRRANPLRAAALLALAEARTERTAAILLDQYHGALGRAVNEVRKCLDRNDLDGARARLEDLVARSAIGLHLIQPWRVVVAGPPNAGKSTLVNAMVGYARAIVDPQPGTTRDLVTALTAIEGWPVELCDTAGLRDAAHPVEQAGVAAARRSLAEADLVLLVFDLTQPWSAADQELLSTQPDAVIVHNKADLAPAASHALSAGLPPPPGRRVSALHKAGLEDLLHAIAARLVPHPPEPGAAIPFMREQVTILVRAAHAVAQGDPEGAQHVLKSLTHHR